MLLVTWNMQGSNAQKESKWTTFIPTLLGGSIMADAVCLQECGLVPPSAEWVEQNIDGFDGFGLYLWNRKYCITYYPWDEGGKRCNLVIVTRSLPTRFALVYPSAGPTHRPAIGAEVQGRFVFCVHAISGGGADARGLVQAIVAAAGTTPWVAAGDFNREPNSFTVPGTTQCPPDLPTYSVKAPESCLDWAIRSGGPATKGQRLSTLLFSDHYPVLYGL